MSIQNADMKGGRSKVWPDSECWIIEMSFHRYIPLRGSTQFLDYSITQGNVQYISSSSQWGGI